MTRKIAFCLIASFCAAPLGAADVRLIGNVVNSCTLGISVGGALVADSAGTTLRSDTGTGARPATLLVSGLGLGPTLTFTAPTLTGPAGFTADTVQFSYSVAGTGQSRGFAATGATATSRIIDTVTINGLVGSAAGFPEGTYTETVVVTCSQ